jgi:aminobenzoyl-glutamate utilization protein B
MNVGINYLREHMPPENRIHYVITDGGDVPNVVPSHAEGWYFIRALYPDSLQELTNRVRQIAQGAALMTETSFEEIFDDAASYVLNNKALADLMADVMQLIGSIQFSEEEKAYAQTINDAFPEGTVEGIARLIHVPEEVMCAQPLIGENFPALDENEILSASTDVGDLSWKAPVSLLRTACWATGAPTHTWATVATGAMSIGHKGMMHAAKIMALAAVELYLSPPRLAQVRAEFESAIAAHLYKCPIPDHIEPQMFFDS